MDLSNVWMDVVKVQEGEVDPLKIFVALRSLESEIKDMLDIIKPIAMTKLESYGKERPVINGFELEIRSRSTYSYPESFEPYKEALKSKKQYEELMKQAIHTPLYHEESGEEIPAAKVKSSTSIYMTGK